MYHKKMLQMLAKRYLNILNTKGQAEAREWETRMFKNDRELVKLLIPVVHELQSGKGN